MNKFRAQGSRVYLPNNSGGFDLRDCPNPEALARIIVLAVNSKDGLMSSLHAILDAVDYTQGNCRLNEPIGGVLPEGLILRARQAMRDAIWDEGETE